LSRAARFSILLIAILVTSFAFADDKKSDNKQVSELHFVILKQSTGKPVRNASIVLHPVSEGGKQAKGGLQLKTDEEGRTSINAIPFGKIRVQVIAPGMQTFGEDYVVDKQTMEFTIKLSRPTEQYSIYK
jgi:hypothetical protein